MTDRVAAAIARFASRRDAWRRASRPPTPQALAERLRALERDVAEVRTRVNGLIFVVAGAVVAQLVLRLVA
jgi:hypothetical protein